jgi:hypothetical protein
MAAANTTGNNRATKLHRETAVDEEEMQQFGYVIRRMHAMSSYVRYA